MNRRTFLTAASLASLTSLTSLPALANSGWPNLSTWISLGSILTPIPAAEAAVLFRNPFFAGNMPPDANGTALVNDNGLGGSNNGLFNLPPAGSFSVFLAFDYATGWSYPVASVQSIFGNADTLGQSTFRVDIFPPPTPTGSPVLVIRIEQPLIEDLTWVVPNMINNTGPFVPHNILISIKADATNTFHIQVAQDNSQYNAFLANPANLVTIPNIPANSGPIGTDFLIPWTTTTTSRLTYYVGNRLVPTNIPGTYIPGSKFDGFANDYYPFHGALGRVVFFPQAPIDIRTLIINNTFEGPLLGGGQPGKFTILPQGGAGVMFGSTPNVNGIVFPMGSVQPSIYLIGGMTYPGFNTSLPPVLFPDNQGMIGDTNTSFYTPNVASPAITGPFIPPVSVPTTFFLGDMPQ